MTKLKQNFLILFFITVGLGVSAFSFFTSWQRDPRLKNQGFNVQNKTDGESYFTEVLYFVIKEGKPFVKLNSDDLTINSFNGRTTFFNPVGTAYSNNGDPIDYSSRIGFFDQNKQLLELENTVKVLWNLSTLESTQLEYDLAKDRLEAKGEVKTKSRSQNGMDNIHINADKVVAWPRKNISKYSKNVVGEIKRKREYEDGVEFSSDTIMMDMNRNYVELYNSVYIKKQELTANAHRGEIFLENYNKKLKYFTLYDDVKVVERVSARGKVKEPFERKSFSEKLEGIMSEEKIILTGYPKVYQQGDTIKGNIIILRENNEVVEVDNANSNFRLR